jgi:hypothetical protein
MATTIRTDISSTVDIIARKDDTFQLKLNITTSDGSAFDLTGAGVIFSVRTLDNKLHRIGAQTGSSTNTSIQDDDSNPKGISSDGGTTALTTDGIMFVHIGKDITNSQAAGTYLYGLQITTGSLAQTFLTGKFTLKDDITGQH